MTTGDSADITRLLKAWSRGDQTALEQLTPLVYAQLRAQARRYMRTERSGVTLETTALVHEVYLRLINAEDVDCHDRVHFFALSARSCGVSSLTRRVHGVRRSEVAVLCGPSTRRQSIWIRFRPQIRMPPLLFAR